jgi:hypothetical protein
MSVAPELAQHGRVPALTLDDPVGLALPLPSLLVGEEQVYVRAWYQLALVVSPDCGIAKGSLPVHVAPLRPAAGVPKNELDGLRADTSLNAFLLPSTESLTFTDGSQADWPEAVVDLARTTPITQGLIADQRLVALGESQVDRLQERLSRYFVLREISSTGSIEAAVGRRIIDVDVKGASKRRNAVTITLDDGSTLELYQEPRRRGPHLETIHIRQQGRFSRSELHAQVSTTLKLRFENDDSHDHYITCPEAGINSHHLPIGTTDLTLQCPPVAGELVLQSVGHTESRVTIYVEPD